MFLRLHNIIAKQLSDLNKSWDDEKLFNEARRICIAIHQHFIYDYWLTIYLGENIIKERKLICSKSSIYCGKYDASIDLSSLLEFSHSAFKFFHSNAPDFASYFSESMK